VVKNGSGRLVLEGAGTYPGPTAVNAGLLEVNAALASPVTLMTNAVLAGEGTVQSIASVGGEIRPGDNAGNSTGILGVNASVVFDGGTDVSVQLGGIGLGQHDRIQSGGSVTLGNARLNVTLNSGYVPVNGDVFAIVVNNSPGPIIGTFAGLPEGATFTTGFTTLRITYVGVTGNDVLLTVANPPATRVWTGLGANGLWSNPTNWSNGVPSLVGDSLVFPAGAAQVNQTNDLPGLTVGNMTIDGDNWNFHGLSLRVTNGIVRGAGSGLATFALSVELAGFEQSTSMTIHSNATLRFSGGLHSPVTSSNLLNGGQLSLINSAGTNRGRTFLQSGQVFVGGNGPKFSGPIHLGGGPSPAEMLLQTAGLLADSASVVVNHNGRLLIDGATTSGALVVSSGRVDLGPIRLGVSGDASFLSDATLAISQRDGVGVSELSVTGQVALVSCHLVWLQETNGLATSAVIIRNDGSDAVFGTFNGLPEGATFNSGTNVYRISYVGGDGNDVTLTRVLARPSGVLVWDGGAATNRWSNPTNWVGDLAPCRATRSSSRRARRS
jgi:autotransporter-associated beta strand protein